MAVSNSEQPKAATLTQQQAVQDYLDTLLHDATTQALEVAVAEPVATAVASEVKHPAPVVAPVEPVVEVPAPTVTAPLAEPDVAEIVTNGVSQATEPVAKTEWIDGRPAWAQNSFECLLFKVAGLTLAVPLVELGSVLNFDEELSPLFGQPDWFMGLLPSKTAGTVRVIDTARWVMPEKYTKAARQNLQYVILMKNSDWGMACHGVAEAVTLAPDQVRWRSDRGRRPWLAGTVIEHMCAIMDVAALVELLNENDLKIKAPQWSRQPAE